MNNFYFHFYCDQTELKREREFLYNAFVTLVGPLNVSCGTDVNLIPNTTTCFVIWMDPPRTSPPFFVRKYQFNTVYIAIDSYKSVMYRLLLGFGFNLSYHMHPLPNLLSILPQALRPFIISHGLSHQVCSNLLNTPPSLLAEREYDLGFVGSLLGPNYKYRSRFIHSIRNKFSILVPSSFVPPHLVTSVYSNGIIGLSLPRADYLKDANTRCFEVMASRCILLTPADSELQFYGFQPGFHYLEYSNENELLAIIKRVVSNPSAFQHMADAAYSKVANCFSYLHIAQSIIQNLSSTRRSLHFLTYLTSALYFLRNRFWSSRIQFSSYFKSTLLK